MARVYNMTWIPSRRGWMKEYKGRKYSVSCRQLGTVETKDGSYQDANAWWAAKRLEIDAADKPAPRALLPMEDLTAAQFGSSPLNFFDKLLAMWQGWIDKGLIPPADARELAERDLKEIIAKTAARLIEQSAVEGKPLPPEIAGQLPPARVFQVEAGIKGLRGESACPAERTVKAQADAWMATQEAQVAAGNLTPDRCANDRRCLNRFVAFLGEVASVDSIDAARLLDYHQHCLGKVTERRRNKKAGWSVTYAKETFGVARSWIRWLGEQVAGFELPKNIASSKLKFGSTNKKIPTWTVEEVRRVIGEAPGKLKLALLLMLNCGMTQGDVSDLLVEEVEWTAGRIIRKRSKTKKRENVPTVDYPLWTATFALLKKYRSGEKGEDRVLLTDSGKPFVRKELVDGRLVKADGFTSNYAHLKRRLKFTKPMKQLRKTAATMLESHPIYGRLTGMFLGHAPASVKDRNYAAPPQALFDEAVLWLGQQLGLAE